MPGGGIREFCTVVSPRALKERNGERLLFALGMMNDVIMEKHRQGIKARFIDDCDASALAIIGNDRQVVRGLTETNASYRERLKFSLDDEQRTGNAWSVLSAVRGYLLGDTPAARTVSAQYSSTGTALGASWNEYIGGEAQGVAPVFTRDVTGNWDWDSASPTTGSWGWWRWYLVLESVTPNAWVGDEGLWGSAGLWGDEGAWGVNSPPAVGATLRIIIRRKKSAICHWVIISFDSGLFTVPGAAGVENPGGDYGHWAKVVSRRHTRARSADARYFTGRL